MLFYYHYNLIHFYRLKKALPRHGNIPAMSMNYVLSLNHGVNIIEKGYKKTVCPDGKYFHQNKLFFIFTLIIFSEHSYFCENLR